MHAGGGGVCVGGGATWLVLGSVGVGGCQHMLWQAGRPPCHALLLLSCMHAACVMGSSAARVCGALRALRVELASAAWIARCSAAGCRMQFPLCNSGTCACRRSAHAWMHGRLLRMLLTRNPS